MDDDAVPGDAFEFGRNWAAFLASVDEERIEQSVRALGSMLGVESLAGQRFMDIGCGSGLSSLAAWRLGATVESLDYDPQCVRCAETLKGRFAGGDGERWRVWQASVLDEDAMRGMGEADIVYSWGVLHHTGRMHEAIRIAAERVSPKGTLFLAIYNDQGGASRRWLMIKRMYHRLPTALRPAWVIAVASVYELRFAAARLARGRNPLPLADWREKKRDRGMSVWYDWVDWVGGLPFEVARIEEIVVPLRKRGFVLENLKTVGAGWGCNEYVFRREFY